MERTVQSANETLTKEKLRAREVEHELRTIKGKYEGLQEVLSKKDKDHHEKFLEKNKEIEMITQQAQIQIKALENKLKEAEDCFMKYKENTHEQNNEVTLEVNYRIVSVR
eukprot:TRINITY_DN14459_c0_g1_i2.p2 TRINITY_DN14459_c0_g1~~TRINITY_DN14459_c0_g1_i2.p2  ORF type:complete len:110 (+),score=28.45 TRINITY_DN14459_c0_g1_i2:333-662(+)